MTPFTFNGQTLRTIQIDDEPWFAARDVCVILGINIQPRNGPNVTVACRKLGTDETTLSPIQGGTNPIRLVSESGLYKLILRSEKAAAKPFQDWVTREVLPSIRKGSAGFPRPRSEI